MPMIIFALVVMGTVAVAAMLTAGDEQRSARAVRESGAAFYAAEAGLNQVWATWDDTLVANLAPGDSLDLGWQTLDNGASYRAVITRYDNGSGITVTDPVLLGMMVEGRGPGPLGGQRVVSFGLTRAASALLLPGAFHFAGNATIGDGGNVIIDGNDNVPPGWGGVCDAPGPAKPGLAVSDSTLITFQDSPTLMGDPPFSQAPFDTLAFDALFDQLVAIADITFPPGVQLKDGTHQIVPVENPPGVCDTSVDTNWGAPEDPTHPCFDYFPVVYVPAGFDFKTQPDHAGQGIMLIDNQAQLENGFSWYGLIMARSDIQVEQGKSGCEPANVYGSMYTKNTNSNTKLWGGKWGCPPGTPGSSLFWSSCVMKRIEQKSAAANLLRGRLEPLMSRAFGQPLR